MKRFAKPSCCVAVLLALGISPARCEEGFKPLFDGKTLAGWDGDPKYWSVEDGAITGRTTADNPTPHNTFLIWRGGKPGDFELRFEFRLPAEGFFNSGMQYRSVEAPAEAGRWVVGGYQADMDGGNQYTGILYEERGRGILALRGQKVVIGADHRPKLLEQFGDAAELAKAIKKGAWNHYRVVARGFRFVHEINGQKMSETFDDDRERRRAEGILAIQLHAGPPMKTQFRNIELKELPPLPAR